MIDSLIVSLFLICSPNVHMSFTLSSEEFLCSFHTSFYLIGLEKIVGKVVVLLVTLALLVAGIYGVATLRLVE